MVAKETEYCNMCRPRESSALTSQQVGNSTEGRAHLELWWASSSLSATKCWTFQCKSLEVLDRPTFSEVWFVAIAVVFCAPHLSFFRQLLRSPQFKLCKPCIYFSCLFVNNYNCNCFRGAAAAGSHHCSCLLGASLCHYTAVNHPSKCSKSKYNAIL